MKITDVIHLRQRGELTPRERERVVDATADVQRPAFERHGRLLAEVEHGPVLHLVLSDRKLRHPVPIRRSVSLRRAPGEVDVHRALVELNLPLNIFLPPLDEVVSMHEQL